ncbi:MAG: hypothetical protein CSA50_08605 [Gammaproteobacteria bacterium]|nr:MAG: hypothetical protein CSA50_08605 [Gammaproteobacteria bacterium]
MQNTPLAIDPLQVQAALAKLKDIQLPDPVSWWPLSACTVYAILAALSLLLAAGVIAWFCWRKNQWRRSALKQLDEIHHQHNLSAPLTSDGRPTKQLRNTAQACNSLIKQLVIQRQVPIAKKLGPNNPMADPASLSGEPWVSFLAAIDASRRPVILGLDLSALAEAGYQPDPNYDSTRLFHQLEQWIRYCP